jgi:hypothetical protein
LAIAVVEVMVTVEVVVPPAVSGAGALAAQVAGKAGEPEVTAILQLTPIAPANPLTEVKVTTSVLPVVAPEVNESEADAGFAVAPVTVRLAATEVEAAYPESPP